MIKCYTDNILAFVLLKIFGAVGELHDRIFGAERVNNLKTVDSVWINVHVSVALNVHVQYICISFIIMTILLNLPCVASLSSNSVYNIKANNSDFTVNLGNFLET